MHTSTRTPRQRTTDGTAMRAITQDRYGEAEDVLRLEEIARPAIGEDEVLLRVHAAGVDRGVWHLMTGLPYPVRLAGYGTRAPRTPVRGREVAGRVEAAGRAVTTLHVGDHADLLGERAGPPRAHQAHRVRPGQASHGPDLPAEPDTGGHPVHAGRPRPGQSRHQPLSGDGEHAERSGVTPAPFRRP
jgi:Alcohol dehydrogenase GroES-like domain